MTSGRTIEPLGGFIVVAEAEPAATSKYMLQHSRRSLAAAIGSDRSAGNKDSIADPCLDVGVRGELQAGVATLIQGEHGHESPLPRTT